MEIRYLLLASEDKSTWICYIHYELGKKFWYHYSQLKKESHIFLTDISNVWSCLLMFKSDMPTLFEN